MRIVIKSGRVIDPASRFDKRMDVLIEDNIITDISEKIYIENDMRVIHASNFIVVPGLIDMHVHFREPGREDVETIAGGSKVAAKSGYTSVCTMPNTNPVIDNENLIKFIINEAKKGEINIFPVAAITKGLMGKELTEMSDLIKAGAVAFSDDGMPVMSSMLMRKALELSKMYDIPLLAHSEDLELTNSGVIHEGSNSELLCVKGIPRESEEIMITRDVQLARLTKGRLHICHVSSGKSVDIIRCAKERGVNVTCETAPHYFSLTDDAVPKFLSMAKMKPPLKEKADRKAIIQGLKNGIIDVIATDHAPHSLNEKMQDLQHAPFGIIGLETAVPLIITELVRNNNFSYIEAFEKVTINPARILKINRGELKKGSIADITIIDPEKKITIDENFILSKCKNSPFIGMELYGRVEYTICNGTLVYSRR